MNKTLYRLRLRLRRTMSAIPYEYEKYVCSSEDARQMINTYGVAIVPNVLSEVECEKMVSGMWDYFEHITGKWPTPMSRDDSNSWRQYFNLMPNHAMLNQFFSIGHAQCSWDVRQNPNVAAAFGHLWNCEKEKLVVSFDGLSFHLPPEITNRGWNRVENGKDKLWLHIDQSPQRTDFECVQGFVTGLDVKEGDGTFVFMEKSNVLFPEFADTLSEKTANEWYKLTDSELRFYAGRGCEIKKIKCPAGSLIMWDSRTVHCGGCPMKGRAQPNFRAIVYVCYVPRAMCSEKDLEKRRKAFEEMRTTRHNPRKIGLFGKSPRTYGHEIPPVEAISRPILTDFGKMLALGCEMTVTASAEKKVRKRKIVRLI